MTPAGIALGLGLLALSARPADAQKLEACSRGELTVCFELLNRPRLDPGRRAAIEFHLSEIQVMGEACARGSAADCAMLAERYPKLPPQLLANPAPVPRTP